MSKITIVDANKRQCDSWDQFVDNSLNGTIFHKRKFLEYHGDRFKNSERWLVVLKGEKVIGQINYAVITDSQGIKVALSPYGGSYGGVVLETLPTFSEANSIVSTLMEHFREYELGKIRVTHPISCCAPLSLDVFTFAMFQHGFKSVNRDISSVIRVDQSQIDEVTSSRARNMERKSNKAGVKIVSNAPLKDFWLPMQDTFARHASESTHTYSQLCNLQERFPGDIWADVAYLKQDPIAGVCYFKLNERVLSSFYFCQTSVGQQLQSLSALIMQGLRQAQNRGIHWVDFGTSSTNGIPGPNIFRFKESFSREGLFRETLEWSQT